MNYHTDLDGLKHFGWARPTKQTIEKEIPENIKLELQKGISPKQTE